MVTFTEVDKYKAYEIIGKFHYSKVMPVLTKKYLLVQEDGEDIGVVTLGRGTQPLQTIKKLFPNHNLTTADYYEIGKMCFIPRCNKDNYGSTIMSALVKFIKQNYKVKFLYTLADGIMGKPGYVYQASNFKYIGSFDTLVYLDTTTGEKIHPRTAKKLCQENARFSGKDKIFRLTYDFMEHKGIKKIQGKMYRYIYPLTKEAKKILAQYTYNEQPPKGKDLKRYEMQHKKKIEIEMPTFNMDFEEGANKKNIHKYTTREVSLFAIPQGQTLEEQI